MNTCRYDDPITEVVYMDPILVDALKDNKNPLHLKVKDAINIFHWQVKNDSYKLTQDSFDEITYYIHHWGVCNTIDKQFIWYSKRSVYNRYYCVFDSDEDFHQAMKIVFPDKPYTWAWKYSDSAPGYEVTSHGDRRYSPFFQRVSDYKDPTKLITAEDYFKLYLKPYYERGEVPPVRGRELMKNYIKAHPGLLFELAIIGRNGNFTDMFDRDGGQNKWYADMLNQYYKLS